MRNYIVIAVFSSLLLLSAPVEAIKLGLTAKGYIAFSSLANTAVEQGDAFAAEGAHGLAKDSTLEQIDYFLASSIISDLYQIKCSNMLHGPQVLVVSFPKRVGSRMIVGFTEEININAGQADKNLPAENGRYLFYWDDKALRASLYKSKNFDELATAHGIDPNDAVSFSFPGLRKLVAAGPPPPPSGDASHLPKELLEAIQADAKAKGYIEERSISPQSTSSSESMSGQSPSEGIAYPQEESARFPWKAATIGFLLIGIVAWGLYSSRSK